MVAIEFDGDLKYTGPEVLQAELQRQRDLESVGWVFARLGWGEIDEPGVLFDRIHDAIGRARPRLIHNDSRLPG